MIPLRDSVPTREKPVVTWILIFLNIFVFSLQLLARDPEAFVNRWALIGVRVNFAKPLSLYPFLSSQFLHAGFVHLFSNMWFLKIFGDNVEERLGHLATFFLYLLWGVVAGMAQYLLLTRSSIPMLGASGAIAGVLGAYLVFFPHHRIETLVPVWGFWRIVELPASLMLFYWFITQLFAGVGSLVYVASGGVAFFAHAGGFVAGWLTANLLSSQIWPKRL